MTPHAWQPPRAPARTTPRLHLRHPANACARPVPDARASFPRNSAPPCGARVERRRGAALAGAADRDRPRPTSDREDQFVTHIAVHRGPRGKGLRGRAARLRKRRLTDRSST